MKRTIKQRLLSIVLAVVLCVMVVLQSRAADVTVHADQRVRTGRTGFLNGSFEADADGATTVTDWTIVGAGVNNTNGAYTGKINLGVTTLGGCVSQDTTDYAAIAATGANPSLAVWRDDDTFNPQGLASNNWLTTAANVSSTMATGVPIVAGSNVMYMNNAEFGGSAYRVIHGPAVVSAVFSAEAGDEITFDWYAQYVRDNYAILGYLLDTSTCTQTEIVDATGRLVSGWQNARVTIPATSSTYRFVFVNGTFDQSGGTNSGATMYIDNITVGRPQTITFVLPTTVNKTESPYTLPASASSTLTTTYTSSTPLVCTVSGGVVTIVATSGTCTLTAYQTGGAVGAIPYAAAVPVTQSFTVTNYLAQTITFGALPDKDSTDAGFNLGATASSTLSVSYATTTTSVCTVTNGGAVTLVGPGTCTITASQAGGSAGGSTYMAATNVSQSFTVRAPQTITFGALPDKSTTDAPFALAATASSTLPVNYVSNTTSVCTVSGGTVTLVGPGTCSITAKRAAGTSGGVAYSAAADVTQTFTVKQGQAITFPAIADKAYTAPDFDPAATASSTLPVSYSTSTPSVCIITAGKIHLVTIGVCTVTATQPGGTSGGVPFAAATPVSKSFDVLGAPQVITAAVVPQKHTYDAPFDLAATADSGLPVEYESQNPAICTVSGKKVTVVGPGTCYVKVTQPGGEKEGVIYRAAAAVTIVINITDATATSTPTATRTATPTPNPYALKKAAVGASFVLGLLYNGTLTTWGMNKEYQANIPPCCGSGITDVSVGTNFAVALKGGRVYGWGSNSRGQITIPLQAQKDVVAISSGYAHTLALKLNGTLVCWGNNADKQCKIPKTATNVLQAVGGQDFSLALLKTGKVIGWGSNVQGQIKIPTGLADVKAITAGCTHAMALKKNGTVVAWGSNKYLEAKVPLNLSDVKEIGAGCNYSMALRHDGSLFGWGRNENNQITIPDGYTYVEHIGVGYVNSIITMRGGQVVAIGAPEHDALISRTPTKTATPTP